MPNPNSCKGGKPYSDTKRLDFLVTRMEWMAVGQIDPSEYDGVYGTGLTTAWRAAIDAAIEREKSDA